MSHLELAKKVVARTGKDTRPIPGEVLARIFRETLDDLNRRTIQGLLNETNPAMLDRERQAKDRLDRVWADALASRATLEDFKKAVAQCGMGQLSISLP